MTPQRRERAEKFRDEWFAKNRKFLDTDSIVDYALAFAATEASLARLEDCRAVCSDCANKGNWQDAEFANGVWFHRLKTSPYSVVECKAGPIHELRRKEGEGNG